MRRLLAGLTLSALLLFTAGTAAAHPFGNWTETWVTLDDGANGPEWVLDGFHFGISDWQLSDIPLSVVSFAVYEQDELVGWDVDVTIPNFVDPLPTKTIKVLFQGTNLFPESLPYVTRIVATDTLFGGGPTTSVICPADCSLLLADSLVGTGPGGIDILNVYEKWELHPNPDWEVVSVFIPLDFEPLSFHIFTDSFGEVVPEPSSLALVTVGLVGLLVAGRRRT